jgi:hypothetical protein
MTTEFDIERMLTDSLRSGNAVGIKVFASNEVVATAVTEMYIRDDGEKCVMIKSFTLYGNPIDVTLIELSKIESVIPLSVQYDDAIYVSLRKLKALITAIA